MSLSLYNKKRKFSETPEPAGKEKSSKGSLRFVIQKHDASHLHYDFRLEMQGVLKSWAIPKGPSLNTADKRLARLVEDHPYDYRNFEGVIPKGNYGAGVVIVWDEGTYEPEGGEGLSSKEQEKLLMKGFHSGNLKIVMHGTKIKGLYTLFRLKNDDEGKNWLLIKKGDEFASDVDIAKENRSVKSGKTLAELAAKKGVELNHPEEVVEEKSSVKRATASPKTKSNAKKTPSKSSKIDIKSILGESFKNSKKASIPIGIKPMLATLVNEPFSNENWLYEIKWDGYRSLAYVNNSSVELISRNDKPFTEKYAPVAEVLSLLPFNAVFDGEIVAVDENGLANFQLLQNWQNTPTTKLQFFIFDIIWLNGYDLTQITLIERKRILQEILPESEILKYSDHVVGSGEDFFKVALNQGLEGIMAKKANSIYEVNSRSNDWLKIKVNLRQEVVIAGFTQPRKTRKFFGALLLGVYEGNELVYVGHTGSGFNNKSLQDIYNRLQPLVTDRCPFVECPKGNMPTTWVKPKLVCEIKFTEWTKELIARHPIFMGLRTDKSAKDVHFEKSKTISSMIKKTAAKKSSGASKKASAKPNAKKTTTTKSQKKSPTKSKTSGLQLSLDNGEEQLVALNAQELKLTNLSKIYWKKESTSKIDLINYYLKIAPYILPYMIDRPQSLHRHPNGITGAHFYQKDMRGKIPDWMQTHEDFSESTDTTVQYLVCSNEATLIYMANLGCIEMHPWHSRSQTWQNPDWCLIDLDPEGIGFDKVIECAQVVKKVLDSIGAESYPKTSGSTGIHIYIPLGAKYNFEQSKQLAELVVTLVNQEIPSFTSIERNPAKRKNKIYLDYLQNRETQTAAAPYSLRPKPGVPVSTPLHWDEVKKGLTPTTYNINNIFDRLKAEGDLYKPVLGKGINMEKILKKLTALTS